MTYILGCRCRDGVVLVADRETTDEAGCVEFGDKLIGDLEGMIAGCWFERNI
jgi:hypothetical protein